MNDDDERIDLSALDPSRDRVRWNARVAAVTNEFVARQRARRSIAGQLAAWARPTLALAAALCLIVWVGALRHHETTQDTVDVLSTWATSGELPPTSSILETFNGANDGSR
jgi:hypothetical protein